MNRPIVSIVGRANVGKSTLFNRLLGRRLSITEDSPGVTRDRHYQEVEWQNKYFVLVDTGGLDMSQKDKISQGINAQVDMAIDESDLILFVVDGREGITQVDREIALKLKKTDKRVILVINKIDTNNQINDIYEFYELSFDELIYISAEQSKGLGDLLDLIINKFDDNYFLDEEIDILKIAVIGKPNVGKSSLVNELLEEERMIVSDIPGTTRDSIDSRLTINDKNYLLIDTAGLRRKSRIDTSVEMYSSLRTYNSIERADICIFLLDSIEGITEQDTKILGYAHNLYKPSIIAVNKWDLIEDKENKTKEFEKNIRNKLSFMPYAPIIFISVKERIRLMKIFDEIDRIDANYNRRVKTGLLNNVIRKALQVNPPIRRKGKTLKIFYVSQIATRPGKFLIYVNDKELMHFSYQRYIENVIRENFDFSGVPIQIEVRERD